MHPTKRRRGSRGLAAQAHRATRSTRASRPGTVSTAALMAPGAPSKRDVKRSISLTPTQRNADGSRSEWSASPYYRNGVTVDARWSR